MKKILIILMMVFVISVTTTVVNDMQKNSGNVAYANDTVDKTVMGFKNAAGGWLSVFIHPLKGLTDDSRSTWKKVGMIIPDLLVAGGEAAIRTAGGIIDIPTAAFKENNFIEDAAWEYCLVES